MAEATQSIIRLVETNVDGRKRVESAIRKIRGVSFMTSNVIAAKCGLKGKKLGDLSESEIKNLEKAITHPESLGMPFWMFNRRREPSTGKDRHLTASTLELTQKMDINEMKKLKIYKGVRHAAGLPVRGQRTRGSFRTSATVGVSKKKQQPSKSKK
jgi:small subunit ribosomal protein S13